MVHYSHKYYHSKNRYLLISYYLVLFIILYDIRKKCLYILRMGPPTTQYDEFSECFKFFNSLLSGFLNLVKKKSLILIRNTPLI